MVFTFQQLQILLQRKVFDPAIEKRSLSQNEISTFRSPQNFLSSMFPVSQLFTFCSNNVILNLALTSLTPSPFLNLILCTHSFSDKLKDGLASIYQSQRWVLHIPLRWLHLAAGSRQQDQSNTANKCIIHVSNTFQQF